MSDDIRINTKEKIIIFGELFYSNWGHVRWLRNQLRIIEHNAEALWGSESEAAQRLIDDRGEKFKFIVIDGGKEP